MEEDEQSDQIAKKSEALQKIIDNFLEEGENITTFHCSPDFTSHDRMLLHEMAEKAELGHASQGDGKARHIVLTKTSKKGHKEEEVVECDKKIPGAAPNLVQCSTCCRQVPRSNIELHKLKCAPLKEEKRPASAKKAKKGSNKKEDTTDDIDKLLATFDKVDNVCNAEKCRTKIATLGVQCDHCRQVVTLFLIKHAMAVHCLLLQHAILLSI